MITARKMEKVVNENFERYAGNVILDRAICDVRDMLKPSARMLIYSQLEITKNIHKKPFVKSARIVGDCLGRLYEHGDSSCYGAYMRMAKPFAMRYPLETCQGNHGTIAGEVEAAMRYTELRLNELSSYIYDGLKANAVGEEWRDNFDETLKYPSVMPSIGYFNICNGTTGLGIAISSSIPQFNLREVNNAIINLIKDPTYKIDLMPDFATGAILTNEDEVRESLKTGTGKACRLRAKMEYNPADNSIIVTEVPYGVMTSSIKKAIEEKIEEDENYGIETVNDNSGGDTPEMYITLSKGVNPNKMIAKLYHDTPLESHFTINMWVLENGRFPKLMGLNEIFTNYIEHIRICKRREIEFELNKALARKNIIEGLLLAIVNIDDIVAIIKGSDNPKDAASALITKYKFNKEQVEAILSMKLSSLCRLDGIKLNDELKEKDNFIAECNYILSEPTALDEKLIEILQQVAEKFGDERRTKIENILGDEEEPEEIKEKDIAVVDTGTEIRLIEKKDGESTYTLPKGIAACQIIYSTNLGGLTLITDKGKMYNVFLSKLKCNKWYKLTEIFEISSTESPKLLIDTMSFNAYKTITCITKHGYIKKSSTTDYLVHSKKGAAVIKLEEDDSIVSVVMSSDDDDKIAIINNNDYYNCYPLSEIATTGRLTKGVKAIKLDADGFVKSVKWVGDNTYKVTGRAVKGVKNG
jgi:DNA gyrase subunit A